MNIYEIEHSKNKKSYRNLIMPLSKAFDSNNKYNNDKFKKHDKIDQDIVNIVICHLLKNYGLVFVMVLIQ
jgi:hypothetical protein